MQGGILAIMTVTKPNRLSQLFFTFFERIFGSTLIFSRKYVVIASDGIRCYPINASAFGTSLIFWISK